MVRKKQTKQFLIDKSGNGQYSGIDESALLEEEYLERLNSYITDTRLLEGQRAILTEYVDEYIANGKIKITTLTNNITTLRDFAIIIGKPFLDIEKVDISKYYKELKLSGKKLKERTLIHKNVIIKQFFKWLYDRKQIEYKDKYPDIVKDLSTVVPERLLNPSKLLTPQDIKAMVEACYKKRDKLVIIMLYESGCRARESTVSDRVYGYVHYDNFVVKIIIEVSGYYNPGDLWNALIVGINEKAKMIN